ncbi:MAG: hypothetical protein QXD64_07090 [Thermoplasmata archaeon]
MKILKERMRIVGIVIFILVVLVICGLPFYFYEKNSQAAISCKEAFALLVEKMELKEKNILLSMIIKGWDDNRIDGKSHTWDFYIFIKTNQVYKGGIVRVVATGNIEVNQWKLYEEINLSTVFTIEEWYIDSTTAIEIANRNQTLGQFFSAREDACIEHMQLFISSTGQLEWWIHWNSPSYPYDEINIGHAEAHIDATTGQLLEAKEVGSELHVYRWYTPTFQNPCFTLCLFPLILFCVFVTVPVIVWRIKKKYGYKKEKKAYEELKRRWEMEEKKNGRV